MKLPIQGLESPIHNNLKWFGDKTFADINNSQADDKFKQNLKQNTFKIVIKLNKSFQEKIDAWHYVRPQKDLFEIFFKAAVRLALSSSNEFHLSNSDRYQLLTFFNYSFNSIEIDFVHNQIRKYLPLSIWINLSKPKRDHELSKLSKRIQIAWLKLEEQDKKIDSTVLEERMFERKFLFKYVEQFFHILGHATLPQDGQDETEEKSPGDRELSLYCHRFLEFIIDIESQLPLRRFFHAILTQMHFVVRCQLSDLARQKSVDGHLFEQLLELLQLYTRQEIDMMTGEPLSDLELARRHEEQILHLQKQLWSNYDHLKQFAIKPIKAIDNPTALYKIITSFDSKVELFEFICHLNLADDQSLNQDDRDNAPLMASILMNHYRRYESHLKKINSIPLFPNESVVWDTNLVPDQYYNYQYPLALPKLNLQFLTISDYLLRNFMLFKNESTYEIRQDLEDGIRKCKCRWTPDGKFATGPKQRYALIIKDFSILDVGKPRLGEFCPSKVRAKIVINMDYVRPEWCREWEQLRRHDTLFLVSFSNPNDKPTSDTCWPEETFPGKNNIRYVRGCEIEALLDSDGKVVDEHVDRPNFTNKLRTYIIHLDCNQYQIDQEAYADGGKLSVYDKFHLIVRRKPEKNNFKGVLETIRELINTKFVVPVWLRDLLIGFGDPAEAHHSTLVDTTRPQVLDYFDTFLSADHATETFKAIHPDYELRLSSPNDGGTDGPPFKIELDQASKRITLLPYKLESRGPYPTVAPKWNGIRFTPKQVEAITSGLQPGLTMIVGPPGTGKTDVAVQILSSLYHTYPNQRILIVTHSNQALNQIFDKMVQLDVREQHLLRLGHGEEDLETERDFSRQGRVRHVQSKRLELLARALKLARSLDLDPGQGLTCESAEYFYSFHIESRWRDFEKSIENLQPGPDAAIELAAKFPFKRFFDDTPKPIFEGQSFDEDLESARACYRYIKSMFNDLRSFRPFEIFQTAADRSKYLLIREAKVIAMTCTHAGLRRKELVEMNFQYDTILMEETAQILEIETTIPLLLQNPENGVNRLKRWIMIGDHNQLPPIIQNSAFQKFSNMEQSLFARFIRLGFPAIQLDAQGRSRSSICDLYRWRYNSLTDLEHIRQRAEYSVANAGFVYDYQLIDVGPDDARGGGESAPMPHYYQNRAEAEYVVELYKHMRILGYPQNSITLLTTYNGQKDLLRELCERECSQDAFIGMPNKITTVDKFQGQQSDHVLLSLVRTRTVGHVRDVRRLVVAMSRARLGLYVFARTALFSGCYELQHPMRLMLARPQTLCLLQSSFGAGPGPAERFGSVTRACCEPLAAGRVRQVRDVEDLKALVASQYGAHLDSQARSMRLAMETDG